MLTFNEGQIFGEERILIKLQKEVEEEKKKKRENQWNATTDDINKDKERETNDRFKQELAMIGAPYSVICNSCDAVVFKIPADEFIRKVFRKEEIETQKYLMVVNLQAKFKAIESKT